MAFFFHIFRFHAAQLWYQQGQLWQACGFFVIVALLFPVAIGPEPYLLGRMGQGVIWVAALLAALLPIHLFYDDDYRDGTLEVLAMKTRSLEWLVLGKMLAQWLALTLPILLALPLMLLLLHQDSTALPRMALVLALGLLILLALGSLAAALTLGLRQRAGLTYVLLLPMLAPVLIFCVSASQATHGAVQAQWMLYGMAGFLIPLCIWLSASAIRHAVKQA